jgi:imidazolonepropionase-like amidohydrolase
VREFFGALSGHKGYVTAPEILRYAGKTATLRMTPAQAIRAATSSAADLIARAQDVGTIEPGKYADIIAVTADPLQDVRALEHVDFVMKGGTVYKDMRQE